VENQDLSLTGVGRVGREFLGLQALDEAGDFGGGIDAG
jgi:hypothetical protein